MMKLLLVCAALLYAPPKLPIVKVAEGIMMPMSPALRPMTSPEIAQQSPSVRAPLAAYTNEEKNADFTIAISATQWPDMNMRLAKDFFKASILGLFDRVDIISEEVINLQKKEFYRIVFESKINGFKMQEGERMPFFQYHVIQYTLEPKRALVFSFHCPRKMRETWEDAVKEMMDGVKMK